MQEENLKTIVFKSMNSSTSVFDKAGKSKIIFMTLPNLAQPSRHVKRQHIKMATLKDPGSLEALCQGYIFALDFHHYHTVSGDLESTDSQTCFLWKHYITLLEYLWDVLTQRI